MNHLDFAAHKKPEYLSISNHWIYTEVTKELGVQVTPNGLSCTKKKTNTSTVVAFRNLHNLLFLVGNQSSSDEDIDDE